MAAVRFEEALREKLIKYVILVLWDEKPRSNIEIARELQSRYPMEFFDFNTDLLAQDVYAYVTLQASTVGIMTDNNGKYSITDENKRKGEDE